MSATTALTVDQKIRTKALAWTIGIHVVLLLIFFLIKHSVPEVLPTEDFGMEVNLGNSDNGSGDDQPMDIEEPTAVAANINATSSSSQDNEKELMESDEADAPVIKKTTNNNEKTHKTPSTSQNNPATNNTNSNNQNTTQQAQRPRYIYDGTNGKGGNSAVANRDGSSEGNTTGNGDRGVIGGTEGASNYTGTPGSGTGGISHTLKGRDISPKRFTAEFNESGKVVIRIKVDRNGNIISKTVKSSPSSTLSKIALQKLSQAKFSPSPDAAPEQFGEITIVFKTHS